MRWHNSQMFNFKFIDSFFIQAGPENKRLFNSRKVLSFLPLSCGTSGSNCFKPQRTQQYVQRPEIISMITIYHLASKHLFITPAAGSQVFQGLL